MESFVSEKPEDEEEEDLKSSESDNYSGASTSSNKSFSSLNKTPFSDNKTDDSDFDSEEEEDDEEESDGESADYLCEIIENNFKDLLDKKISATEAVYDNYHHFNNCPTFDNLQDKEKTNYDSLVEIIDKILNKNLNNFNDQTQELNNKQHKEIQTDEVFEDKNKQFQLSGSNSDKKIEKLEKDDDDDSSARNEIGKLRDVRESLVNQRSIIAQNIKDLHGSIERHQCQKKVIGFEEVIEAIDFAIEFKNEIICGGANNYHFSNEQPFTEINEQKLLECLSSLKITDLQKLLSKNFAKIIELRHSSRHLEKQLEDLEENNEKMSNALSWQKEKINNIEKGYESRLKEIMKCCSDNPQINKELGNYIYTLDKKLTSAKKKQFDLERSLTELLVRHGYLTNGADYDVKQVVKMLGIDAEQMGLKLNRKHFEGSTSSYSSNNERYPKIPHLKLNRGRGGEDINNINYHGISQSRRMKEAYFQKNKEKEQQKPDYDRERERKQYSSRHHRAQPRYFDSTDFDHHNYPSTSTHHQNPPLEVRREKKKIIIEPTSGSFNNKDNQKMHQK